MDQKVMHMKNWGQGLLIVGKKHVTKGLQMDTHRKVGLGVNHGPKRTGALLRELGTSALFLGCFSNIAWRGGKVGISRELTQSSPRVCKIVVPKWGTGYFLNLQELALLCHSTMEKWLTLCLECDLPRACLPAQRPAPLRPCASLPKAA